MPDESIGDADSFDNERADYDLEENIVYDIDDKEMELDDTQIRQIKEN